MEWQLAKGNRSCSVCRREFKPGEDHFAGIEETAGGTGGFQRRDLCLTCWVNRPLPLFSYWRTRVPVPPQKPKENVQAAIAFFDKLAAEADDAPIRRKLHYLLALILLRRRRLKLIESHRKDGVEVLILEKVWTGETIQIADPVILEEEIDQLKEELGRLFDLDRSRSAEQADPAAPVQA